MSTSFSHRHIGPTNEQIKHMLNQMGINDLNELINQTIPEEIRLSHHLSLSESQSEHEFLESLFNICSSPILTLLTECIPFCLNILLPPVKCIKT